MGDRISRIEILLLRGRQYRVRFNQYQVAIPSRGLWIPFGHRNDKRMDQRRRSGNEYAHFTWANVSTYGISPQYCLEPQTLALAKARLVWRPEN